MPRTITTYYPNPAVVRAEIDEEPAAFALTLIVGGRRWGDSGTFPTHATGKEREAIVNEHLVALMGSALATLAIEAEAPFPVLTPRKS